MFDDKGMLDEVEDEDELFPKCWMKVGGCSKGDFFQKTTKVCRSDLSIDTEDSAKPSKNQKLEWNLSRFILHAGSSLMSFCLYDHSRCMPGVRTAKTRQGVAAKILSEHLQAEKTDRSGTT